jgi:hypothetical protein
LSDAHTRPSFSHPTPRKLSKSEPHPPILLDKKAVERGEVFKQAAARGSTRRKTLEEACTCTHCHSEMGTLYLRGKQEFFESGYTVDVVCLKCAETLYGRVPCNERRGSWSEGSKKRTRESPRLDCEVCKQMVGTGGVRKGTHSSSEPWEEPHFSIELVCTLCATKYMFCSECGGGGKRTGKWRPISLFAEKRKTCSLPHIRVGDAAIHYRTIEIPREMNVTILRGVKDVYWDSVLSLLAVPQFMETQKYRGQLPVLMKDIEHSWNETVLNLLTAQPNSACVQPNGKRYLTMAWIDKFPRSKQRKSSIPCAESNIPWLTKLAQEGIVAPNKPVQDPNETCFVAFSIAEWNQNQQTLFMMQMAPRSLVSFIPLMLAFACFRKLWSINSTSTRTSSS